MSTILPSWTLSLKTSSRHLLFSPLLSSHHLSYHLFFTSSSHHLPSHHLPSPLLSQVIFIICAVVALTILVNGSLSRSFYSFLYRKIHLQTAEADAVILHYVRKRIWQKAEIGNIYVQICCVIFCYC